MSREIKFRQFLNGNFHYWGKVDEYGFTNPLGNNPDLESYQYTGRIDKNEVDIYEGDINHDKFQCIYSKAYARFIWTDESGGWYDFDPTEVYDIISNIHQPTLTTPTEH